VELPQKCMIFGHGIHDLHRMCHGCFWLCAWAIISDKSQLIQLSTQQHMNNQPTKQPYKHANTQAYKQTHNHKHTQADKLTNKHTNKQTDKQTNKHNMPLSPKNWQWLLPSAGCIVQQVRQQLAVNWHFWCI
jgi:hypothetical protein